MRWTVPCMAAALLASSVQAFEFPAAGLDVREAYGGFDFPVSFAFAPDGRVFVTEKAGEVDVVDGSGRHAWARLEANASGEQGVLGLALEPDFALSPRVYVYYSDRGNGTNRIVRFTDSGGAAAGLTILLDGIPGATFHNGGVLEFAADGTLFAATGDALDDAAARDTGRLNGKVLRIHGDGSIPGDNPFPGSPVYSYGHRNVFGLAADPTTGDLWATENGPDRDDEVNRIVAGGNYGWPDVTGVAGRAEFVDPAYVFPTNLPALTQATFLGGALFFGGWNSGAVYRASLSSDRRGIVLVEIVHVFSGGVTDVEVGLDGRLYASVVGGSGGAIYVLPSLPPIGTGRENHWLSLSVLGAAVGTLFLVYMWRRRALRRERS